MELEGAVAKQCEGGEQWKGDTDRVGGDGSGSALWLGRGLRGYSVITPKIFVMT